MRLSGLIPAIPANLVTALEASGVRTEADLLSGASAFDIYKRLPAGTVTLQEVRDCINLVASLSAAPGVSGSELYQIEQMRRLGDAELRSGNDNLDSFLKGLNGRVIEISGDRVSGKSTVALNLVLHSIASTADTSAVWIDTTGDFSAIKAAEIISHAKIAESALERIQISFAFDVGTAQVVLDEIYQLNDPNLRFVVVDCITPLLGPLLSSVSAHGHAIMTEFMQQLRSFSEKSGATVLVVNNTASKGPDSSERKPALGPSFILMTDTTLWLRVVQDNVRESVLHSISILKSHSKPAGPSITFRIHDHVICPA